METTKCVEPSTQKSPTVLRPASPAGFCSGLSGRSGGGGATSSYTPGVLLVDLREGFQREAHVEESRTEDHVVLCGGEDFPPGLNAENGVPILQSLIYLLDAPLYLMVPGEIANEQSTTPRSFGPRSIMSDSQRSIARAP